MDSERATLRIGKPEKRTVLKSDPDRTPPNNNGNKVEEEKHKIQKPWVILIERFSENGVKMSFETTDRAGLDPSLESFLKTEAERIPSRVEKLKESIREASEVKEHGKRRSRSRVQKIRKSLNDEIGKTLEHKEVLLGNRRAPLKIKIIDDEATSWEFPRGGEGLWAQYVGNENPLILELPSEDVSILEEAFVLRHAISLEAPDVKERYYQLLEKVRGRDDLLEYFTEFTRRFSGG